MSASGVAGRDLDELEARTRALLSSDRLTAPTRRALEVRLAPVHGVPRALSTAQMRALEAACLRLIPEPELVTRIGLAARLDARLADSARRGWRYAGAPEDSELITAGLDALDAEAGSAFADRSPQAQDDLLRRAQAGDSRFGRPELGRWFEELLNALVELFYAHPLVQVAIGYDGMADLSERAVGFQAVAAEGDRIVA